MKVLFRLFRLYSNRVCGVFFNVRVGSRGWVIWAMYVFLLMLEILIRLRLGIGLGKVSSVFLKN